MQGAYTEVILSHCFHGFLRCSSVFPSLCERIFGGFLYGFFRQRCCEIQLLVEEPMHANVRNNLYRSAVFAFGIYLIWLIIFSIFW